MTFLWSGKAKYTLFFTRAHQLTVPTAWQLLPQLIHALWLLSLLELAFIIVNWLLRRHFWCVKTWPYWLYFSIIKPVLFQGQWFTNKSPLHCLVLWCSSQVKQDTSNYNCTVHCCTRTEEKTCCCCPLTPPPPNIIEPERKTCCCCPLNPPPPYKKALWCPLGLNNCFKLSTLRQIVSFQGWLMLGFCKTPPSSSSSSSWTCTLRKICRHKFDYLNQVCGSAFIFCGSEASVTKLRCDLKLRKNITLPALTIGFRLPLILINLQLLTISMHFFCNFPS